MVEDEIYTNQIIDNQSTNAYKALIERYENRVFSLCLKIIKQREEAEEVAQDIFLVSFKKITELQDKNKFPNWLMKIAYSRAIGHIRKNQIVKTDINVVLETYFVEEQTPVKQAILKNRAEIIKRAILLLDPVEASLITLYYIQDVSVKDIAEITELSLSNVKVKLHRARISLKTIITSLLKMI